MTCSIYTKFRSSLWRQGTVYFLPRLCKCTVLRGWSRNLAPYVIELPSCIENRPTTKGKGIYWHCRADCLTSSLHHCWMATNRNLECISHVGSPLREECTSNLFLPRGCTSRLMSCCAAFWTVLVCIANLKFMYFLPSPAPPSSFSLHLQFTPIAFLLSLEQTLSFRRYFFQCRSSERLRCGRARSTIANSRAVTEFPDREVCQNGRRH